MATPSADANLKAQNHSCYRLIGMQSVHVNASTPPCPRSPPDSSSVGRSVGRGSGGYLCSNMCVCGLRPHAVRSAFHARQHKVIRWRPSAGAALRSFSCPLSFPVSRCPALFSRQGGTSLQPSSILQLETSRWTLRLISAFLKHGPWCFWEIWCLAVSDIDVFMLMLRVEAVQGFRSGEELSQISPSLLFLAVLSVLSFSVIGLLGFNKKNLFQVKHWLLFFLFGHCVYFSYSSILLQASERFLIEPECK